MMKNQRALFRLALSRQGELRRGQEVLACELLNLTEQGVQLKTDASLKVGEEVRLQLNLTDQWPLHCTILVSNVSPPYVGARISVIAPSDQVLLSRLLEQLQALTLTGF